MDSLRTLVVMIRAFAGGALGLGLLVASACGEVATARNVVCGAQPVAVLANGGFDDPTPPWAQLPVTPALLCGDPRITPDQGALAACLGATDDTTQELSQTVDLPEGATSARLTGRICIATAEVDPADHDQLTIELLDGANPLATVGHWTDQQGAAACQFMSFDMTAPLTADPPTATLRIRSTLNATMPTSFYVDTLALTISCD